MLPNLICRQTDRELSLQWRHHGAGIWNFSAVFPWIPLSQGWFPKVAAPRPGCAHTLQGCCSPRGFSPCPAPAIWGDSCSVSNSSRWCQLHQGETTSAFNVAHQGEGDPCALLSCSQGGCSWFWETQPLVPTKHNPGWHPGRPPSQNRSPAPPWRLLISTHVRGKRGLEAPRKCLFICLFVCF